MSARERFRRRACDDLDRRDGALHTAALPRLQRETSLLTMRERLKMNNELPDVQIKRGAVYFNGELVRAYIAEGGITVSPGSAAQGWGSGRAEINRLTVTFLVGKVDIEDPISEDGAR